MEETSTKWIEGLALDEINMEESGIVHMNEHIGRAYLLEEASIDFMDRLKDHLEFYSAKFNEYRGGVHSENRIKIFKISNTVNDFMLFRNSLRLIFNRKACDVITVTSSLFEDPHEITATVGPFNQITWKFQGEPVAVKALTRHYFSQFTVGSAR